MCGKALMHTQPGAAWFVFWPAGYYFVTVLSWLRAGWHKQRSGAWLARSLGGWRALFSATSAAAACVQQRASQSTPARLPDRHCHHHPPRHGTLAAVVTHAHLARRGSEQMVWAGQRQASLAVGKISLHKAQRQSPCPERTWHLKHVPFWVDLVPALQQLLFNTSTLFFD